MISLVGRMLGQYQIIEKLGQGGMGAVVYRAHDLGTDREVALKMLPLQLTADPDFLARFQIEGQVIARLEHPHILPLYAVGEQDGQPYLVMRYVTGGSLRERMDAGQVTSEFLARVVEEVADALEEAHRRGVVHRDIKPSNILLDHNNHAYLADFGLAKIMQGSTHFTASGGIVGTPAYMAPEQWRGETLDGRADVYALGCVIFEIVTGSLPYYADGMAAYMNRHLTIPVPSARVRCEGVSRALDRLLRQAMAKRRDKRPASATQFAHRLSETLQADGWQPRPAGPSQPPQKEPQSGLSTSMLFPRKLRNRQLVLGISGGLAVLGAALLAGALALANQSGWGGGKLALTAVGDVGQGEAASAGQGYPEGVRSVAWSPDGTRLASATEDGGIIVWAVHPLGDDDSAATGEVVRTLEGHPSGANEVAWTPDGTRLASAMEDGTVVVWAIHPSGDDDDAETGELLWTLEGHAGGVRSVAWSPDGTQLASGSWDYTVIVWDAATGGRLRTLKGHTAPVRSVAWSPDGTWLASGSWDRTVIVWEAATGKRLLTLEGHMAPVRSVAWSPDGTRLASGSLDRTVGVWEAATGKRLLTLEGHADGVRSVAWSPDGTRLASGSWDHTVIVWDADTGEQLRTLGGHMDGVRSVAWSPDGTRLASVSEDGKAIVWVVAPEP